ncbi:uncharacterized protein EV422DRAFT_519682 [Fimicolochytrium jonesii]|uniref:uncharacterized protein n=1 Tax=Fimicolochytrium jonesii TaxID=1396493 RepID=UPI0022FF228B|nr:uncharacterized protein EV422DRAFT_519682 [Fimicolochytrium jonesii]KAI8824309.1 hypothetical protein EV422DRAFT_519682 [Fimicolochytrium jonesii]
MSRNIDNARLRADLTAELSSTMAVGEDTATLTDYCILLVGMEKDRESLIADLSDVTSAEDAEKLATWITQWLERNEGTGPGTAENGEDHNGDMVIHIDDAKSDEEVEDDDDPDQHPRRSRVNSASYAGTPASLLVKAVLDSANNTQTSRKRQRGDASISNDRANATEGDGPRKAAKIEDGEENDAMEEDDGAVRFTITMGAGATATHVIPSARAQPDVPRCTYWPNCTWRNACKYWHPKETCPDFPNCTAGNQCYYIHPDAAGATNCRFGAACTRPGCAFSHPYGHGGMARRGGRGGGYNGSGARGARGGGGAPPPAHLQKTQCRFYPNCTNVACPYFHPVPHTRRASSSASPAPQTAELCKFEPLCTRENCTYSHPSRSTPEPYKSKKFTDPITDSNNTNGASHNATTTTNLSTGGLPGTRRNKTLVLNSNRPHISDRSFAFSDGVTEHLEVGKTAGTGLKEGEGQQTQTQGEQER